jgi:hypothetical protein
MGKPVAGEVVVLPFPQTDLRRAKPDPTAFQSRFSTRIFLRADCHTQATSGRIGCSLWISPLSYEAPDAFLPVSCKKSLPLRERC